MKQDYLLILQLELISVSVGLDQLFTHTQSLYLAYDVTLPQYQSKI